MRFGGRRRRRLLFTSLGNNGIVGNLSDGSPEIAEEKINGDGGD